MVACPWDSPDKNTRVGCHSLLQGIFPTQGSNPGLLHCRQILFQLSYQGSPNHLKSGIKGACLVAQMIVSACNVGDSGSVPGFGRCPGEAKCYPLQYSGLENSMDCIVHGVTKSQTWRSDFHFHILHSAYKLNKQSGNIQPWHTPFPTWN